MTAAEKFISLALGIIAILTVLLRIAWALGQMRERFDNLADDVKELRQDVNILKTRRWGK